MADLAGEVNLQEQTQILPISVCILCKNEEDRLANCLSSIQYFGETIVLDTGSTDQSVALAKECGANVFEDEWKGFTESRKTLFSLANHPWILWIDADEVMTNEFITELFNLFKTPPKYTSYQVNRIVQFQNQWIKHGVWFPDYNIRLFKSDSWTMEDKLVHESIIVRGESGRLNSLIEHHTYRDWADQKQRSEKYSSLWALQKAQDNKQCNCLSQWTHSAFAFIRCYLLKKGFLDGILGFKIATAISQEVFLKYKKLYHLLNQHE
ncbi:MAG: glycosyltransferase family 2 protein [Planctomycetes bacterium]|nr:glycosyltransferase family 2 protein [Planctomycetota bacterium]